MVDESLHGRPCKGALYELHGLATSGVSCSGRIMEILKDLKAKIPCIWDENLVAIVKQIVLHRKAGVFLQCVDDVLTVCIFLHSGFDKVEEL
jgi:hypothetical protein